MLTYGFFIVFVVFVGSGVFYVDWSYVNWMGLIDVVLLMILIIFFMFVYYDLIFVMCAFL